MMLALNSLFRESKSLLKIYPLNAVSSENAVMKESPREIIKGVLPKLAPKLNPPYFRKLVRSPSPTKINPKPSER